MFNPARAVVVLIEFQFEWIDPAGRLYPLVTDASEISRAATAGLELLGLCRRLGLMVVHAGLSFEAGHPELGAADLGLRHHIPKFGTFVGQGAEWAPGFQPIRGEFIVKGRVGASAFAGSNLDALLRNRGVDTVILAGFALHVCVESTLRHAHDLSYRAYLAEEASAAFAPAQRQHVVDSVVPHFGACLRLEQLRHMIQPGGAEA